MRLLSCWPRVFLWALLTYIFTTKAIRRLAHRLKKYREDFQRFINNYEVDKPGLYGPPDVNKERAELDKLLKIEAKAQKYPESLELQGLRAQIEFLKFERELDSLLKQQKIGEARAL